MTERGMAGPGARPGGRKAGIGLAAAGAVVIALAPAGLATPARAQAAATAEAGLVTFDIPPQMLDGALTALADQAGLVLLFSAPEAASIPSDGLRGPHQVGEALRRLLAGTGYGHRFVDGRTVTIDPVRTRAGSVVLPDMLVTTTAAGYEQKLVDAPASVTVIPREELEKRPFRSLSDAVRHVEGVNVVGGDKGSISIRGMEAGHVLILVDGKRQETSAANPKGANAEGLAQNWIPPLEAIERIEVVRGPMSTLYGSEAMGGVINVITRKVGRDWSGAIGADYTAQGHGRYGDEWQGDVYLSGPLVEDRLGLQVWGYEKRRDEDDIASGHGRSLRRNGTARLTLTPDDIHEIQLEGGRTTQEFRNRLDKSGQDRETEYTRDHMSISHGGNWSFGRSDVAVYREVARREGPTETWRPEATNIVADAKLVVTEFEEHVPTIGLQWKESELSSGGYRGRTDGDRTTTSVWERSAFVENEWRVTDSLSLTGGLRVDDNEYFGDHWTPRAYAVWRMAPDWTLKGGIAKGFKSPALVQINPDIGNPQRGGAVTWGNPDLQPEESVNTEIGLYYEGAGFSVNATLFNTDYKNKIANTGSAILRDQDGEIIYSPDGSGTPYSGYFNIGEATMRGLELAGRWQITERLGLRGNYTFIDSEMNTKGATFYNYSLESLDGEKLVGVPDHTLSLTLDWLVTEDVSTFVTGSYRSRESRISFGQGNTASDGIGSTTTFDLGGTWKIHPNLSMNAAVYNVTDQVHEPEEGKYWYVEDGRRFWLGLRASF
ncbi:TonB-dependent receptor domain-containing protein [Tistrella mobilis]|uniref:TonB-dependent receptor domain-containing protein n=1 Tax=Tistrella mobilis TaxID=171437 RepID=UPI0035582F6F